MAAHHEETRFVVIDGEKAPFIVDRLKIWCIPSMCLIINQKTNHVSFSLSFDVNMRVLFFFFPTPSTPQTIAGLDELTGDGKYTTVDVERLLNKHNMLNSHVLEDRQRAPQDDDDDADLWE